MVLVQTWPFFHLFFLGGGGGGGGAIYARKMCFYDILERKNVFLIYKNRNLKKSKN